MRSLRALLNDSDAQDFGKAVDRIKTLIFSGSYRRDPDAWTSRRRPRKAWPSGCPLGALPTARPSRTSSC
jgi:hypothetical protein